MKRRITMIGLVMLLAAVLLGCRSKVDNEQVPETVGQILLADFEQYRTENPDCSAQEMADHLMSNSIIKFSPLTMAVEEGLLTGFNNAEITGFQEGVMFAPMIGSIPFVGYVFTLEEGADAEAFIRLLSESADPRWNICTEAEETVTGKAEDMIFFVMSPANFE
ncbi:MAG: hypothetical protein ACI4VG_09450 [Lachnospiraceae bacterium]